MLCIRRPEEILLLYKFKVRGSPKLPVEKYGCGLPFLRPLRERSEVYMGHLTISPYSSIATLPI